MSVFGLETLIKNVNKILDGERAVVITTGVSGGKQISVVATRD